MSGRKMNKKEIYHFAEKMETLGSEYGFDSDDICLVLSPKEVDLVMEDWEGTDRKEFKKSSFLGFEIVERER